MKMYSVYPVCYEFERYCDDDDSVDVCFRFRNTQIIAQHATAPLVFALFPRFLAFACPSKNSGCRQKLFKSVKLTGGC